MSQKDAARVCSVSESLVSQLLADNDFRNEVEARKAEERERLASDPEKKLELEVAAELDGQYDGVELLALKKLGVMVKTADYPWKPTELASVVKTLNSARRRQGPLSNASTPQNQINITNKVVQLNIPAAMQKTYLQPEFVIDEGKNQVVEVNGRRLDTFNSKLLLNAASAEERKAKLLGAAIAHETNQFIEAPKAPSLEALLQAAQEQHENSINSKPAPPSSQEESGDASGNTARAIEQLTSFEPHIPLNAQAILRTNTRGLTADDF